MLPRLFHEKSLNGYQIFFQADRQRKLEEISHEKREL